MDIVDGFSEDVVPNATAAFSKAANQKKVFLSGVEANKVYFLNGKSIKIFTVDGTTSNSSHGETNITVSNTPENISINISERFASLLMVRGRDQIKINEYRLDFFKINAKCPFKNFQIMEKELMIVAEYDPIFMINNASICKLVIRLTNKVNSTFNLKVFKSFEEKETDTHTLIIGASVSIIIPVLIILALGYFYKKNIQKCIQRPKERPRKGSGGTFVVNELYQQVSYSSTSTGSTVILSNQRERTILDFDIPRELIKESRDLDYVEEIGSGNFGQVYKGFLNLNHYARYLKFILDRLQ